MPYTRPVRNRLSTSDQKVLEPKVLLDKNNDFVAKVDFTNPDGYRPEEKRAIRNIIDEGVEWFDEVIDGDAEEPRAIDISVLDNILKEGDDPKKPKIWGRARDFSSKAKALDLNGFIFRNPTYFREAKVVTVSHELGHTLGLYHNGDPTYNVMSATFTTDNQTTRDPTVVQKLADEDMALLYGEDGWQLADESKLVTIPRREEIQIANFDVEDYNANAQAALRSLLTKAIDIWNPELKGGAGLDLDFTSFDPDTDERFEGYEFTLTITANGVFQRNYGTVVVNNSIDEDIYSDAQWLFDDDYTDEAKYRFLAGEIGRALGLKFTNTQEPHIMNASFLVERLSDDLLPEDTQKLRENWLWTYSSPARKAFAADVGF